MADKLLKKQAKMTLQFQTDFQRITTDSQTCNYSGELATARVTPVEAGR